MGFEIRRSENGRRKLLISHFGCSAEAPIYEGADVLGGKGNNLRLMSEHGVRVPPGFTLVTQLCSDYMSKPKSTLSTVKPQLRRGMRALKKELTYAPLVSVRSGARVSMPGMMDTILNVGLTSETLPFWSKRIGKRNALDCRRRLIQMFGCVVDKLEPELFEAILTTERAAVDAEHDSELSVHSMQDVVDQFEAIYKKATGRDFPDTVEEQLLLSVEAVFCSWDTERALHYRKMNGIPHTWGTAVTVQAMVFGNAGETSGSGVLFTRNPATGENELVGEFLPNAQGEDVVAGIRTPSALSEMEELTGPWPVILKDLNALAIELEEKFGDMQDVEFTVQKGQLFILQTRSGKRTAPAAFRIVAEMAEAGTISKAQALARVTSQQFAELAKPGVDPSFDGQPISVGLGACPGIVTGTVTLSNASAVKRAAAGEPVILVREETSPDDLPGMDAAVGVLTARGGMTSHAAVVAREMNTPCVVGAKGVLSAVSEDTEITINGQTGEVFPGRVPVVGGELSDAAKLMVEWAYEATGSMPQGPDVICPRQRVTTYAWNGSVAARNKAFTAIAALDDRSGIILDLDTVQSVRLEEDAVLWGAFGEAEAEVINLTPAENLIAALIESKNKLAGCVVYLPALLGEYRNALKAAGYKLASEVSKLSDLFESDGFVNVTEQFVDEVCGGPEAYSRLIGLLAKDGASVKPLPVGMSVAEVAAAMFGKE